MVEPAPVLLRMSGMSKSFPGVQALQHVDLTVRRGECLALVGENGAGKSTLMKILSGVYAPDTGTIEIDGQPVVPSNPHHAQQLGVSIIYQEFNLFPNMSIEENIFIGREPNRTGFVDRGQMRESAKSFLRQVGVDLDPRAMVRDLSVAQQQMVEIAKALSYNAQIVIMDEPTSALTDTEVRALFTIIRGLKDRGLGVVFVSHRLEEIFEICDRVTVLRDGQNAGELDTAVSSPEEIVRMMVGREMTDLYQKDTSTAQPDVVLEVRGLSRRGTQQDESKVVLDGVDLKVHAGEIVGLAGLVGSGRTEVARAIFGADAFDSGEILLEGTPVRISSPAGAIRLGIALAPEDRKLQALVLALAIRENISLPNLGRLSTLGFVKRREERNLAQRYIDALSVRTPSMEQKVVNLSGGNQQKVVLAKWLALDPKVLIVDEPTRGIDIGAKAEVHSLLSQLAAQGVAVLMISSELPEVLGMSDRIYVMREGKISGVVDRADATEERVMELATGVAAGAQAA
ncbi:MAG: sugar ABC transporter ATP-binding protein [Thermomicrobiales bacterium]|nr:sugar ABC transporter ATP-binding protein [Thermomicrobiales bacterium]